MHRLCDTELLVRSPSIPDFSLAEIRLDVIRAHHDIKHIEIRFTPLTRMMLDGERLTNPTVILAMVRERAERPWRVRVSGTISLYRPVNGYTNAFVSNAQGVLTQWFFKIKAEEITFLD